MAFTDELKERNAELWERMVTHPFIVAMGEGTLPVEVFRRYWLQDYLFIRDLVTVVALAIAKAPDFDAARRLSGFLNVLLTGEDDLFQRGFRQLGVTPEMVARAEPLPAYRAYSDYLVRLAHEGHFDDILTAICCAEWTYADWATRLVAAGKRPQHPTYREWTDIHATREFLDFVAWLRGALDREAVPARRERLQRVFADVLRYEWLFWEMAYRGEQWPR